MKARVVTPHKLTNPGKLKKLVDLQSVYRKYAQECVDLIVKSKCYYVPPKEFQSFFLQSPDLSSQLQKCARMQAASLVHTWVKSLYSRLKKKIHQDSFSDQQRMELRCVGKFLLTKAGKFGKGNISQEMVALYWSWVWDKEVSGERPQVHMDFPMWLSEMCVTFDPPKKADSLGGWWIKVSTLENRKRVCIPLMPTPFLSGDLPLAKSVLIQKRHGVWTFQFTDKSPLQECPPQHYKVGVDVGLNVLAATSDGRIYGQKVKSKFDRLYKKIRDLRANRQRQGFKENSKRLDRLETRLSGMLKTEIGQVANQLVRDYPEHTFVIEDLDLRGCRGQKRFTYKQLHRSLSQKAHVQVVNAAYTSQQCPSCGYISRKNRSWIKYHCRSCGRVSHADVIGARNLLGRSEDKQISPKTPLHRVKAILRERYRLQRDSSSRSRRRRTVRPDAYCESPGSHSVKSDPI